MQRAILYCICIALCYIPGARAQFTGMSIPQTIATTPFNNVACTGAPQTALIANMAQTEHFAVFTTSGVVGFRGTIQGSEDGVTFNDVSDVATTSGNLVMGQGYYPVVQISVTCSAASGTFTVKYSGQATAPAMQVGALQSSQIDKTLAIAAPANTNFTSQLLRTPFGNSGGAIYFQYSGAGPANSFLSVSCGSLAVTPPSILIVSYPLATPTATQFFAVPLLPCDFLTVAYTSGGASAVTFTMSYVFNPISITGGDPCQGSTAAKKSVAVNTTATQKLVVELAGHAVFVCGFTFTVAGSATATALLEYGTGATCGTGTTVLSGAWLGAPVQSGGGGYSVTTAPAGNALCLVAGGGTPSVQGILTYVQQ